MKKGALLKWIGALVLVAAATWASICLFGKAATSASVQKSIDSVVVSKIDSGIERALHQEAALMAVTGKAGNDFGRKFSSPVEYEKGIHQYLETSTEAPVERDQIIAKDLVKKFVGALAANKIEQSQQSELLYRMGQYYYHQALFSASQGYPPTVKIRLLRLAIEHLNQSKWSSS